MFFILSTGRCGSKTLAGFLNRVPGIACPHEPAPPLVREARAYIRGMLPEDELVSLLRQTRRPTQPGERYGESNLKLSFLVGPLCKAFPEARFVWLVRDGREVVNSYYNRGAYRPDEETLSENPNEWVRNRIRADEAGVMSEQEWQDLDPFARICWYWKWTNERIRDDLAASGAPHMLLHLERLAEERQALCDFLELPEAANAEIPHLNRSEGRPVTSHAYWDRAQRDAFQHFCGPMMDELYPDWRESFRYTPGQEFRNALLSTVSPRHAFGRTAGRIFRKLPEGIRRILRRPFRGRRN